MKNLKISPIALALLLVLSTAKDTCQVTYEGENTLLHIPDFFPNESNYVYTFGGLDCVHSQDEAFCRLAGELENGRHCLTRCQRFSIDSDLLICPAIGLNICCEGSLEITEGQSLEPINRKGN